MSCSDANYHISNSSHISTLPFRVNNKLRQQPFDFEGGGGPSAHPTGCIIFFQLYFQLHYFFILFSWSDYFFHKEMMPGYLFVCATFNNRYFYRKMAVVVGAFTFHICTMYLHYNSLLAEEENNSSEGEHTCLLWHIFYMKHFWRHKQFTNKRNFIFFIWTISLLQKL